jgi:hypothetical protein
VVKIRVKAEYREQFLEVPFGGGLTAAADDDGTEQPTESAVNA